MKKQIAAVVLTAALATGAVSCASPTRSAKRPRPTATTTRPAAPNQLQQGQGQGAAKPNKAPSAPKPKTNKAPKISTRKK